MYSRREILTTATLSLPLVASIIAGAKAAPAALLLAPNDDFIRAQTFAPLPNFKKADAYVEFMNSRFVARAKSRNAEVTEDGRKAVNELIAKSAPEVFAETDFGPIDKSKKYRNLPIPIRQAIAIRNLDSISDAAIVVAEAENKKSQKGVLITASVIQSVRDFFCPMFPFCTG